MELTNDEPKAVEIAAEQGKAAELKELGNLDLVLVGGGNGVVVW